MPVIRRLVRVFGLFGGLDARLLGRVLLGDALRSSGRSMALGDGVDGVELSLASCCDGSRGGLDRLACERERSATSSLAL